MSEFDDPALVGLGLALASGLLIGLERGWQQRERPEGHRVAGVRTFALIGLLGGLGGLLAQRWEPACSSRCSYSSGCIWWWATW
ncbi:MgtC/SapB family protein [Pseudomonas aeruginosa]|nr:MgtC/SapB family protein [Pseudomonas aeruginosa]